MRTRPLTLFTISVSAAGAVAVAYAFAELAHTDYIPQWLLFSGLVLLMGRFTSRIASVEATISVSDTFFIAAALLFGPGPAMITLAADGLALSLQKGHDWHHISFNTFGPAVTLGVAAHAFFAMGQIAPLLSQAEPIAPLLLPLMVLTIVYFGLNSVLISVVVGLESRRSILDIWQQHLAKLSLSYFAAASMAVCLVLLVQQVGVLAVLIVLPVVAEFHLTLQTSFGRLEDTERHLAETERLFMSMIETLAMAMDAKDTVTHNHVRRVQALAKALAAALGITDAPTLKALDAAALLHDTGKLAVPEYILNKPGRLTVAEFAQMKRHVDIGADILSLVAFPYPVVPIVRCHHENWDGSGYPRGVAGADIPIGARILSVVDCYDAVTSDRPYHRRVSDEAALSIVGERRGTMYDPAVVDAFAKIDRRVSGADRESVEHTQVLEQLRTPPPPSMFETPTGVTVSAPVNADRLTDVLVLSTIAVQQVVPAASGAWFIPDAEGRFLRAIQPFGRQSECLEGLTIRIGDKLTGWVAAYRLPILNSDSSLDLSDPVSASGAVWGRCLSIPVMNGDVLAGVLTLYASDVQPFNEEQSGRLQEMAPDIARAICASSAPQPTIPVEYPTSAL